METAFVIIAMVASLVILVLGSMALHEGLRDHNEKTSRNTGLLVMSIVTLVVCGILYFYLPYFTSPKGADKNMGLLTSYIIALMVAGGISLGVVGVIGAEELDEKTRLDNALKTLGGVGLGVGIAGVVIGGMHLYGSKAITISS